MSIPNMDSAPTDGPSRAGSVNSYPESTPPFPTEQSIEAITKPKLDTTKGCKAAMV